MPDLSFEVNAAAPVAFAAAPTMGFSLWATNQPTDEAIHNVLLTVQIQIEAQKRRYSSAEQARLFELFGEPSRWGQTLRPMLWTHVNVVVPPFTGSASFELHAPCTFDFNVAATKYFDALGGGDVPLIFLFSGTVFYAGENGGLQVSRISWSKEARFRLPAVTWRQLIEAYYPNAAWLTVRKDVFDRLSQHRTRNGFGSWEQTLEDLLDDAGAKRRKELAAQ